MPDSVLIFIASLVPLLAFALALAAGEVRAEESRAPPRLPSAGELD